MPGAVHRLMVLQESVSHREVNGYACTMVRKKKLKLTFKLNDLLYIGTFLQYRQFGIELRIMFFFPPSVYYAGIMTHRYCISISIPVGCLIDGSTAGGQ